MFSKVFNRMQQRAFSSRIFDVVDRTENRSNAKDCLAERRIRPMYKRYLRLSFLTLPYYFLLIYFLHLTTSRSNASIFFPRANRPNVRCSRTSLVRIVSNFLANRSMLLSFRLISVEAPKRTLSNVAARARRKPCQGTDEKERRNLAAE